ncbi:alkaline phosphatase D family protein [Parvularcula sp. LCG005]|uniref:alkaline phosphatase D family protein n=1 Tax=Parvularcula sp. LCG005 TaxID=3078805 RepID=UPI0029433C65|nr:alkaline phosphatase D family protein [Parvularcula sp. LCG005]WOI54009.1 alkaline phosphatase D family protein [Parvularcula sp. LCG005]
MKITRRQALLSSLAGGVSGCASLPAAQRFDSAQPTQSSADMFRHGVASGDPAADSVVLWTRISNVTGRITGTVRLTEDDAFSAVPRKPRTIPFSTDAARDHTVKVLATGLKPGTRYTYRFEVDSELSPEGTTRTLSQQAEEARFAVVSCSNFPFGFFNVYDHIARQPDIDAVIHLGDYLYEFGPSGYGGKSGAALGRNHEPPREILTLADYRQRHAQYKGDPSTQSMHAAHPLIAVWDDHETANDAWQHGAENHQPATEGDWEVRKAAALQAYYEWMPVRDPVPGRPREALFRSFTWPGLLTIATLETRLTARSAPLVYTEFVPTLQTQEDIDAFQRDVIGDPSRRLISDAQMDFLRTTLKGSVDRKEPWRLLANQVMFASVIAPNLIPYADEETIQELEKQWDQARAFVEFSALGLPINLDAWDGFPADRERVYAMARSVGASDLVVLTGDTHEGWANDLFTEGGEQVGVELGATGVTSPGPSLYLGDKAFDYSLLIRRKNKHVRYHEPLYRGYVLLSLSKTKGKADFVAVSTVTDTSYDASVTASFDLRKQDGTVKFAAPKGLGVKERYLYST